MSTIYFKDDYKKILADKIINNDRNEFIIKMIEKNNNYSILLIKYTIIPSVVIDIISSYTHKLIILKCRRYEAHVNVIMYNWFDINISIDTDVIWISDNILKIGYNFNDSLYDDIPFISSLFRDFQRKNRHYAYNMNYIIETDDPYSGNMCCNNTFNYYMYYYYNKINYIKINAMNYDQSTYDQSTHSNVSKLIDLCGCPSYLVRNTLCIYEKQSNMFIQTINTVEGYPVLLIKPINHHKMKRMIIIIKLLLSVISKYIVQMTNEYINTLVLYQKN